MTIYAFEGLGWGRYIERGIIDPLLASGYDFKYDINNWYESCPVIRGKRIIVLMHSMGAGGFNCLRKTDAEIDLVVTMDPRVTGKPYVKPMNVKRLVNFYQTGFMRGYPVEGADAETKLTGTGHTAIPRLPEVHAEIIKLLS